MYIILNCVLRIYISKKTKFDFQIIWSVVLNYGR